jgi:hypothetical protein
LPSCMRLHLKPKQNAFHTDEWTNTKWQIITIKYIEHKISNCSQIIQL